MYISYEEPVRTVRFHSSSNGDKYVLVGGENHKTGQDYNENEHYANIIKFANETFQVQDIPYRWSAQDYIVMDDVPFIGHISTNRHNILVATGFKKWGMTHSAVAAMIIRDTIFKGSSEYEEIFRPSRTSPVACMNFLKENLNVAQNLISGKIKELPTDIDLEPGEGNSFEYEGRRVGAYRDEDGKLYIVDTKCKHLGCEVRWNSAEKTWDCPCHASRYNCKGEVIEGPAMKDLERLE
jgi:nitrite reductase/ring-hydroxylating ferredoxin subunit